jgi:hypothetical protein
MEQQERDWTQKDAIHREANCVTIARKYIYIYIYIYKVSLNYVYVLYIQGRIRNKQLFPI